MTVTSMTPKGIGSMGLLVWQQLESRQFDSPVLGQGWATVALQLLVTYKSHHASAFGSHAYNCQFCNASWDL
ncbi:unnamed protein product [Staurois parvus]|uniref:Uncharacterized protein n=1 Tax=Staurois parvus TaxID=386267 RepID=A0ABN9FRZ2_9NEOB|nr:unnamed protein product [Staurois parvus]